MGIEPMSSAWKAEVLPLNYTRRCTAPADHLEPRSVRAPPQPKSDGGGGRIRTFEGVSRQIYSLLPLAAWVPLRENEPRILIFSPPGVNACGAVFASRMSPQGARRPAGPIPAATQPAPGPSIPARPPLRRARRQRTRPAVAPPAPEPPLPGA